MFNAVFASISKRSNSTLIPTLTGGTTISIELLDETSIISPSIRLYYAGNPTSFNYCSIPEFGNRYYYINEWTSDHNQWIASMTIDVLASWKTQILAHSEYVTRSASESNGSIIDTAYPATVNRDFQRLIPRASYSSDLEYYPLQQGKSFIVGITGAVTGEATDETTLALYSKTMLGSVSYYWLSPGELFSLCTYLMSEDALTDMWQIDDISDNLQKGIINPLQYINSVIMLPFDRVLLNDYDARRGTQTKNIYYGYFKIAISDLPQMGSHPAWVSLWKVADIKELDVYFKLTPHPYAATRGKYLNFAPWVEYQMNFEPFGTFSIDTKNLEDAVGLYCHLDIEGIEGMAILKINALEEIATPGGGSSVQINPRRLIYYGQAQIGVPISIAQITQDYIKRIGGDVSGALGIAGGAVGMAASIATGNVPGAVASGIGIASTAASMIGNAVESMAPNVDTKGSNGNIFSFTINGPYLYEIVTYPVDDDNTQLGRPLCAQRILNTLTGFCMTRDADIAIAGATEAEINQIKGLLNSGFFIE